MTHRPRVAAVLVSATLSACRGSAPPDLAELQRAAYSELDRGRLDVAADLARRGQQEALDLGDPRQAWAFRVIEAETLVSRREGERAVRLLASPPPVGVTAEVRARGLMTHGFAICLAAHGTASQPDADRFLAEAEQLARETTAPRLAAEVALRQGTCALRQGADARAEVRFRDALATSRAAGLVHLEAMAAGSLGLVRLRSSRYDDAADWLQRSIDLSSGDAVDMKFLSNLGWCYTTLGDTEKALPLLLKAEDLATRNGFTESLEIALFHLGNLHIQLRDLPAAQRYFERSLALARELHQNDSAQELLELLQTVALRQGDVDRAQAYAREAARLRAPGVVPPASSLVEAQLLAERRDFDPAQRLFETIARATNTNPDVRWKAFAGLASLNVARGNPEAAERAFRDAQQAIERMRATLEQDTFDFLLFSSLTEFYGRYAAFLVDRGRAEEALALVDHSRGRVLWERLGSRTTARPPERFEPTARTAGAVLLSYWVGERSFLWVVTPQSTEVHELPAASVLRARVEQFQAMVLRSRDPLEATGLPGMDLYALLVAPAASRIPKGARVIVVPDGPLHQLSFDTLVVPGPTPHYWVEDVVSLRAPSLGLLTSPRSSVAQFDKTLLLIGDPVQPSAEFPTLPHAARELAEVARPFADPRVSVLAGRAATASAYREADPSRFEYIHFAAHATSHSERPLESAVVLSGGEAGYKLYAREIVGLPIHADMVTLSACRGAGARAYRGEGLVGFAWAFLRAGARHVVAGLWNVEDASTASLMGGLYARLAQGQAPPDALRAARLDLLRSPGAYRKPFYWGPFVIYAQQQRR